MVERREAPGYLDRFGLRRRGGDLLGLFVRKGLGSGSFLPLEPGGGPYVLGRSPDATIRLEDEGVSRRHAEIVFTRGRWALRDLGSTNGTFLNSLRVRDHEIAPRDVIVLGVAELLVVSRDPTPEVTAGGAVAEASGTVGFDVAPLVGILGEAGVMPSVREAIRRVSPLDVTVVLRGESGTGKELVARAIHSASARRDGPFLAVNCGAIPEALVESELFGHEKGAFTGATAERVGRFEEASGGTLFLDEIGDLPAAAQVSFLRVLQDGMLRRVGGKRDVRIDVRIVAATHRDLEGAVRKGLFRNDLYHRLNVFEIVLPPLRDRLDDLPMLTRHFLADIAIQVGRGPLRLSEGATRLLRAHVWPGNIRELRNVLERAAIRVHSDVIGAGDIAIFTNSLTPGEDTDSLRDRGAAAPALSSGESLPENLAHRERELVRDALEASNWNQSEAARRLGVLESKVRKCIKQYGLKRGAPPPSSV